MVTVGVVEQIRLIVFEYYTNNMVYIRQYVLPKLNVYLK